MAKKPKDKKQEAEIADDVLIREVDDEMRAERLQAWWQKFGSLLVGACVFIVLATIAYQIADSYRVSQAEDSTAQLLKAQEAVEKGQTETALKELNTLATEGSDAADLAKLQAAYLSDDAKPFEELSKNANVTAIANAAHLQLGKTDTTKETIFYPLEAEQKAVALLSEGKQQEARTLLLALLDRVDIPSSQRTRLNELLQGAN